MAILALAGNPNSGKTSFFNALTGARQHVSNYPGITVERKNGNAVVDGQTIQIEDLPGIYSLSAYSAEEVVARNFLLKSDADAVIDVVDGANLERNLYLALQIREMGVPLCVSLNMMDAAKSRGITIDEKRLSECLGNVPVVPTIARHNKGVIETVRAALSLTSQEPLFVPYGPDIEATIAEMVPHIEKSGAAGTAPARWLAVEYLEGDSIIRQELEVAAPQLAARMKEITEKLNRHLQSTLKIDAEAAIADQRYGYIRTIIKEVVKRSSEKRTYASDVIDKVLTHRVVGLIIMFALVYFLYVCTFVWGAYLQDYLQDGIDWLSGFVGAHMADGALKSLVLSGVIDGVGAVLSFAPLILIMFLGISFMEDSGYLARMAYMLDRVFRYFGLHGSSVMPFLLSGGIAGGCAVPGVFSTRTIRSQKERIATLLTVPFMNCGAKLPVFAMLIAAFFSTHEALIMVLVTVLSWAGALIVARCIRWTALPGEGTPFVMELPPYRWPTLKGILIHTLDRTWQYFRKAGTVILAVSILLWALMAYPSLPQSVTAKFDAQRATVVQSVLPADRAAFTTDDGQTPALPSLVDQDAVAPFASQIAKLAALPDGNTKDRDALLATVDDDNRDAVTAAAMVEKYKPQIAALAGLPTVDDRARILDTVPQEERDSVLSYALAEKYAAQSDKLIVIGDDQAEQALANSYGGWLGHAITPLSRLMGFDWKTNIALIGGFAAKEVIVSSLGTAYSLGDVDPDNSASLSQHLAHDSAWRPLTAITLIVFSIFYVPCFVTVVAIGREAGIKWALFSMGFNLLLSIVLAIATFQVGSFLGY